VAYVASVYAVASYHCIILHCIAFVDVAAYWPRPYRYKHCTLLEDGYDAASYLVGYGGSGHAYASHLHSEVYLH
jgi:hypothetical protein